MTGLVRGLLAAPVAALVGWLGAHGIGVDPDLVGAILGAVVAGLLGAGMHAAEDRWPWLRRLVAWLGREVPTLAPTGPDGVPIITTAPATSPAGPSNVRRVPLPPDTPSVAGMQKPGPNAMTEPTTGPQTPSGVSSANPAADQPPGTP